MINIILNGCNGKMGQVISRLAADDENVNIVAGFDIFENPSSPYPVFTKPEDYQGAADVVIDFSHPDSFENIIAYCKARKLPVIVATTGLSNQQKNIMEAAAEDIPLFFSANMSLGINLLIDLAKKATKLLGENFDIEIIEKHHNQKIDAPSGTALAIADAINETCDKSNEYIYDRHSTRKKRSKNEIGIHAVRGGTIVGEHSVIFAGTDEIIELKHTATSKEIFAVGAVKAAAFVADKAPGFYNMSNLIEGIL